MRSTRLLLVRPAATAANLAGRYAGQGAEPLAPEGQQQALRLGTWLRSEAPTLVVSCGGTTAQQTLEAALGAASPPAQVDARWRDRDYGAWEGLSYAGLLAHSAAAARAHWADPWHTPPPDGETLAAVATRTRAALDELLHTGAGQTVLLLAGPTPLQLALAQLLGTPPELYWRWKLDLASLSCVELYAAGPIVNWLNRGYQPPPAC